MSILKTLKIKEHDVILYVLLLIFSILLAFVGEQGEPYSLPLLYAMLTNGLNLPLATLFFLLSGVLTLNLHKFITYACLAIFQFFAFFLFRKFGGKNGVIPPFFLLFSIPFFVVLFPLQDYAVLAFLPLLFQKIFIGVVLFVLGLFFSSALKIILEKIARCRLAQEEMLLVACLLVVTALGLYKCIGSLAYFGTTLFFILLYIATVKNATAMLFSLACALAPALITSDLSPFAYYALYAGVGMFFMPFGKTPATLAVLLSYLLLSLYNGLYLADVVTIILSILSCVLPCLAFLLLPKKWLKTLERKLVFYRENHLSRLAINRNRAAIGDRLFTLSNVFRSIENTFQAFAEEHSGGDRQVKLRIARLLEQNLCATCSQGRKCPNPAMRESLDKLIAVGAAKGRVTLIDLPDRITAHCVNADGVLFFLNQQLAEYRKYRIEAENAQAGRLLMASQAQGVSELLKDIALQQSQPIATYDKTENDLRVALAKNGVICSEILIYGEDENISVTLTVFGKCENAKIARVVSETLGMPLLTSEKLVLASDKFCYILRKKPRFDAVFGVASRARQGESQNGDSHSLIRIDEKQFLTALADGMGSGVNAQKVSSSALSLLESFYRAGMPADTILDTVNKLLVFKKEESFACIDLARVNLDSGRADVVKIGAPLSFIFTEGKLRVIESTSLPMGMLDELRPTTLSVTLQENDVLLFLSDGVTDAFGSAPDLCDYLKTLNPLNPQTLADEIVKTALRRNEGVAKDDMTALAVRIFTAA